MNVVEQLRQIPIALHGVSKDVRDEFLVGGTEKHVAIVPVRDPQHLFAVVVVPAAFAPEARGLYRRHQQLLTSGGILFFANDLFDLLENSKPQRQPRIDSGARLSNHAGTQHQAVRNDLRFRWSLP